MAQQTINVGTAPNDGTGTPLRTAFQYTNSNFSELYTAVGPSGNNIVVPGSATITGDLTVDTSTLKVDSANNRVGIGTASPTAKFQLAITGSASAITRVSSFGNDGTFGFPSLATTSTGAFFGMGVDQNSPSAGFGFFRESTGWNTALAFYTNNQTGGPNIDTITERYRIASDGVATWSNVGGVAGTAMTLNSTGLGVGGSPSGKIHAQGTGVLGLFTQGTAPAAGLSAVTIQAPVASGFSNLPVLNFWYQNTGISNPASECFAIRTSSTDRLYIDASGNVGIGVTPSASWTGGAVIQQQNGAVYANSSLGSYDFSYNSIRTASNSYVYAASSLAAARFQLRDGAFNFFTAPSGTAGNAITFTQAMTLDASGNLLVGTTSAGGNRLNVQTASGDCTALIKSQAANVGVTIDYVSSYGNFNFAKSGTAKWSLGILNDSASTPTFKLFNDAAVGVYVTYGGTSWTATSDERLKDIIEPISNAVAKVGSLRSVIGKFKSDDTNTRRSFLIAQDVQAVLPEAVDASNPEKLGVAYSEVIPLLVAAIKELTARVQILETR